MTNMILLALAFLCGLPVGAILGLIVAWHMLRPESDDEPDYSGVV